MRPSALGAFLQALGGDSAEPAAWTADISYWIAGHPPATVAAHGWDTEAGYLRFCAELGCMPYYWYPRFWAWETAGDHVRTGTETRGDTVVSTWESPAGTLRQHSRYAETSKSWAITRYPVETAADLRILLGVLENTAKRPANLADYRDRMRAWTAYDGLPALGLPRSPLPALFTEWTGVQNGVYLMQDEPELAREVLARLEAQEAPIVDALCTAAPPLVHFPDNLTSEVYTPFFEEHMAGRYERRLARLHAAGVRAAVHLDGRIRGLLPLLAGVGFDAVEALTPQPAGDVDVADMRAVAGNDRVALWGGVPGALFAPPYTWRDMEAHVRRTVECWRGGPFILGVADQVPPDGDISMVRRIADLIAQAASR